MYAKDLALKHSSVEFSTVMLMCAFLCTRVL
jgi:hypothetical protein